MYQTRLTAQAEESSSGTGRNDYRDRSMEHVPATNEPRARFDWGGRAGRRSRRTSWSDGDRIELAAASTNELHHASLIGADVLAAIATNFDLVDDRLLTRRTNVSREDLIGAKRTRPTSWLIDDRVELADERIVRTV